MKRTHLLLVEDNEGDILLTKEALEERNIINEMSVVKDGKEAILFLLREGIYGRAKTPDIILLDINLPKKSGHEVLEFIKTHDDLKQIPVIMLTTSSSDSDIRRSYKNHANCFITKPIEVGDFIKAISVIEDFWFNVVALPPKV
ncbi:response regulator [Lunatibacter salilacus]|uniref:response regulator n=1 Tax=Lunatibacter salilacus TaxID=2483804 RepID=UPI00131D1051|nr:response regulator [Lunatibacter salilacus]